MTAGPDDGSGVPAPSGRPVPRITVMAAIARNGVIGHQGAMPWHLPDDMRRFRRTTMGSVLVMGRRTYESIGRPLPGRTTVVVTRQRPYPAGGPPDVSPDRRQPDGLLVAGSVDAALELAAARAAAGTGEVFVQGGTAIYAAALPLASRLLITWVDDTPDGDTFFPDVDWSAWREESREEFPGGAWSSYRRRRPDAAPALAEVFLESL